MRRCTGLRPSRQSGSARPTITDSAYAKYDSDASLCSSMGMIHASWGRTSSVTLPEWKRLSVWEDSSDDTTPSLFSRSTTDNSFSVDFWSPASNDLKIEFQTAQHKISQPLNWYKTYGGSYWPINNAVVFKSRLWTVPSTIKSRSWPSLSLLRTESNLSLGDENRSPKSRLESTCLHKLL